MLSTNTDFLASRRFVKAHPTQTPNWYSFEREDGVQVPAEFTDWGQGVYRLRINPKAAPNDGLIIGQPGKLDGNSHVTRFELQCDPLRINLWRTNEAGQEELVGQSITDEHFTGRTRLPILAQWVHESTEVQPLGQAQWTLSLALHADEALYGLGEKFTALNKRSQFLTSRVEDALGVNTDLAYKNSPFVWSPEGWGVLVHTTCDVAHGLGYAPWSSRSYCMLSEDESLDLFFFIHQSPTQLLRTFTSLTGRAARVPLWSLGAWASKAYYKDEAEILKTAQEFRDRRFPVDVITYDGRAWQDTPTRFHFHWDPSRYPNVRQTNDQLKALGYRICCWEYPLVSINNPDYPQLASQGYFLRQASGSPYVFNWDTGTKSSPFGRVLTPLPPSSIVDFTNPQAYAWWRDAHRDLFDAGCDTIKSDFGEQVPADAFAFDGRSGVQLHNVYSFLYNQCVWEASESYFGDQACLWGRAGWIGSQRFPVQWGGDPQSDWEGLAASIRGGLSWGLSGAPYHATDVGGFYGAKQPEPELYVRWVQAAVFASHFRVHGIGPREPWAFGERIENLCRQYFELRYALLPYLKAVCDQAARTGLPVMRAMALSFPLDRLAAAYPHQFLCGDDLLIMPVLNLEGKVEGWLPDAANWVDAWTGEIFTGGQLVRRQCPLEQIPVFIREGGQVPVGPVVQHTAQLGPPDVAPTITGYLANFAQLGIFSS